MKIPDLEQFGSTIFVRDAYKHIYNIIIWGDISASSDPGHRSYVVLGTPGKLTVNPFTFMMYRDTLSSLFSAYIMSWQTSLGKTDIRDFVLSISSLSCFRIRIRHFE